jgi:hypothetical protein
VEAGLRTGGIGREGMIATCVVVGLGRIGWVVRLGEGFTVGGVLATFGTWVSPHTAGGRGRCERGSGRGKRLVHVFDHFLPFALSQFPCL